MYGNVTNQKALNGLAPKTLAALSSVVSKFIKLVDTIIRENGITNAACAIIRA